ncbi:unnamed protein product [Agarophyton chilense]
MWSRQLRIPAGSRKCYDRFATGWTDYAKVAISLEFRGTVDLIRVEDPDVSPGFSYAAPRQFVEVLAVHGMEAEEESSLALSVMLYYPNENWKVGDHVFVRTCATGRQKLKRVQITKQMIVAHREDVLSIEKEYEVAVSVLIPGLTSCYYVLTWIGGLKDTGVTYALTFRGSEECVTSHINMQLGNQGKKIVDPGEESTQRLLVGAYVISDKAIEESILRFISTAMCTTKLREVLRPANSCALGSNVGNKTFWDIVMTSKRILSLGCLLTNKFYVVHTASGLKAFEVTSVSTTARHTNWNEVTEELVGVIELDHVILG